jgi:hypothetical protein
LAPADNPRMNVKGPVESGSRRAGGAAGLASQALLWAGPLGVALATLVLVLSAPYFRSGSGVPTAGDVRAWNSIWAAVGLTGAGCAVGFVTSVAWIANAVRARRRPSRLELFRTATGLLLGVAFGFVWFGR